MKATITERGQISIPARLRREMDLKPGRTIVWERVSATECRMVVMQDEDVAPDPVAALGFARQNGLNEGSSDAFLEILREGESDEQNAD